MMSGKTNLAALAPGGFPPERIVLPSPSPGLQSSHYHACTALPLKCAAPTHPSASAPCLALLRSGTRSSRGCSRRSRSGYRRGPAQRSGAVVLADRDKPARHCKKQQCHTPLAARTGPPLSSLSQAIPGLFLVQHLICCYNLYDDSRHPATARGRGCTPTCWGTARPCPPQEFHARRHAVGVGGP